MSSGQTLQPGDVLATGTPAGVGKGKNPPVFLNPGDEISISVTCLGTLTNRVAQAGANNPTVTRISQASAFELTNSSRINGTRSGLKMIDGKSVSIEKIGEGSDNIIFVHGLGMSKEYWRPLIDSLDCPSDVSLRLYDFEGHGLTPTHPLNPITISSLASDLAAILEHAAVSPLSPATIYAHDIGCLVAMKLSIDNPGLAKKLVLFGPVASPFLTAGGDEDIRSQIAAR
ncbi:Alpha/Beta hydrolase protein [Xylariaceae sp. FL1272]|nr:Alpha/Beta hydrolase protein [Xylariaceae sp. FL1272]